MQLEELYEEIIKQADHLYCDSESSAVISVKSNCKYDSSTNKRWSLFISIKTFDDVYDVKDSKVEGDDLIATLRCLLQNLDDKETLTFDESDVDYEAERESLVSTGCFTD